MKIPFLSRRGPSIPQLAASVQSLQRHGYRVEGAANDAETAVTLSRLHGDQRVYVNHVEQTGLGQNLNAREVLLMQRLVEEDVSALSPQQREACRLLNDMRKHGLQISRHDYSSSPLKTAEAVLALSQGENLDVSTGEYEQRRFIVSAPHGGLALEPTAQNGIEPEQFLTFGQHLLGNLEAVGGALS